jgi:TRAP-type C4-dicarboxylate transport system permease small subunit
MFQFREKLVLSRLDRISARVAAITEVLVIASATAMILALVLQVFSRYVLGSAFSWTEEAALGLFTWTILLAATTAIRDVAHVKLDMIVSWLPPRARLVWSSFVAFLVLAFCLVFAWTGTLYVEESLGQVTAALRLPVSYVYLAAPVTGILGAFHALVRLLVPLDLTKTDSFA